MRLRYQVETLVDNSICTTWREIFFINHSLDDEHGFALLTFYLPTFDFIKIVQVKLKCNHFLSSSCVKLSFTISEKNAKDLTNRGQNDLVARSNTK